MMVILTIESGQLIGHRVWLNVGQSVTVGRDTMSDWPVSSDSELSRKHLQVDCHADQILVRDLDSLNGTFVNEVRIKEHALQNGDWIRAGSTCLRVEIKDARPEMQLEVARSSVQEVESLSLEETDIRKVASYSSVVPAAVEEIDRDIATVRTVVVDFTHNGSKRTIWLRPGETLSFGRTDKADVATADSHMSGLHFQIACDSNECSVRDLNSRNGLFLNELQVRDGARIYDGDLVDAGSIRFSITVDGGRKPPATEFRTAFLEEQTRKGRQIDANFATYVRTDCASGLAAFCDLEGQPPASEVFRRIAKKLQPLLIIDPGKIESIYDVIAEDDTTSLVTWTPEAADFSPRIYIPPDPNLIADRLDSFWGADGMVCLFADEHSSESIHELGQLTKRTLPQRDDAEFPPQPILFAYYWPNVISILLEHDVDFSKNLFAQIEAVMIEADGDGAWKMFADSEFENNLSQIGLRAEQNDEDSEAAE